MQTYYHALSQTIVGDWVSDFNEASRGSIDCVQATQRRLEQRHSLETTLAEVKVGKLMTPMYVISLAKPNDNPMK
jgi:hypothetical protein